MNAGLDEAWQHPERIDEVARRYAAKGGRGRRAVVEMLRIAAAASSPQLGKAAAMNAGSRAVWVEEPLVGRDRRRWLRTDGLQQARRDLERLGEGLCLRDGCPQRVDRRRLWCSPHEPRVLAHVERDPVHRRIRVLLNAAADALGA